MTLIAILLAAALAAALGWALRLRSQLRARANAESPAPDAIAPMVHAIASTFDAGVVVIDAGRLVRYLNPQAETLLNIERTNVIGEGLIALVRDYQIDALVGDVLRDHEPREMVIQPPTSARTLRLRASSLNGQANGGAVLLIRDVTQISMLERARRDMVANVSHELRTPLASVKLLVETVQSEPPPHIAQRMLGQMAQEVDAITQLVDELHELSQIEAGRVALQLSPAALAPVATRAIDRIRPQAERKALHVSAYVADSLPPALMDTQRIGQVLLNLLHNAMKFTPAGGDIVVRATVVRVGQEAGPSGVGQRQVARGPGGPQADGADAEASPPPVAPGSWIMVSVSDTGVGIPQRDLPRIFERFYKVDRARTRNVGGTGLGLAIAKHLVEGHGGRIWATSLEGAGSTFYFMLPVAED